MFTRQLEIATALVGLSLAGCSLSCQDDRSYPSAVSAKLTSEPVPVLNAATEIEALIAERGSLTFHSYDGEWIGADCDTAITFLPEGKVFLVLYRDAIDRYRGTYRVSFFGQITLNLLQQEPPWPPVHLFRDSKSLILMPQILDDPNIYYLGIEAWPYRPIEANREAKMREEAENNTVYDIE